MATGCLFKTRLVILSASSLRGNLDVVALKLVYLIRICNVANIDSKRALKMRIICVLIIVNIQNVL